ncbi:energy transducer TonB [Roseivirga sp.]|uniref:energy transducer TonB n=1 Tax=Roseivirga sp. TaxID=1964215 RepID=UPI002B271D72|nr:energy transducer TonB [Roseivirga sp.]
MIRATLSLLSLLLCFSAFAQEVDTVYFNQKDKKVTKNDASVFRYDVTTTIEKNSSIHKYLKDGTLLERVNLEKKKKEGDYYALDLNDSIRITGTYKKNVKVDKWTSEDLRNGHTFIDLYDMDGVLISKESILSPDIRIYEMDDLDTHPSYKTGEDGWNKHLMQNLKYPVEARRSGAQGEVKLRLTILSSGKVAKVEVQNSEFNMYLAREALRVAQIPENWNPGIKEGKAVNSYMDLRIVFKLG